MRVFAIAIMTLVACAPVVVEGSSSATVSVSRKPPVHRPVTLVDGYTISRWPIRSDGFCGGGCDPGYYAWLVFKRPYPSTTERIEWTQGGITRARWYSPGTEQVELRLLFSCYRVLEDDTIVPGRFVGPVVVRGDSGWEIELEDWTNWYQRGVSSETCW